MEVTNTDETYTHLSRLVREWEKTATSERTRIEREASEERNRIEGRVDDLRDSLVAASKSFTAMRNEFEVLRKEFGETVIKEREVLLSAIANVEKLQVALGELKIPPAKESDTEPNETTGGEHVQEPGTDYDINVKP